MSRRSFLAIWIVIAILLVLSSAVFYSQVAGSVQTLAEAAEGTHLPEIDESSWTTPLSLLASLATLIGFVSTTILAWRREVREVDRAKLDLLQQAFEIEKLRHELDLLKIQANTNATATVTGSQSEVDGK